jgi:hypothetical protein
MKHLIAGILFFAILLALPHPARAECAGDQQIAGDTFTLPSGESADCNLVIWGGQVIIEDGATVPGSVIVYGGQVDLAGEVGANVTVFGGDVNLRATADIHGDLTAIGGDVRREAGVTIGGSDSRVGSGWGWLNLQPVFDLGARLAGVAASSVGMGLLALVVLLFWAAPAQRVGAALTATPVLAGLLGLITLVTAPLILLGLTVTVCLIPLAIIGVLLLNAGALFGWIALGALVGERLLAALRLQHLSPAVGGAAGTFLITLLVNGLTFIITFFTQGLFFLACLGSLTWLIPLLLTSLSLGAVVITRFGTREYLAGAAVP